MELIGGCWKVGASPKAAPAHSRILLHCLPDYLGKHHYSEVTRPAAMFSS